MPHGSTTNESNKSPSPFAVRYIAWVVFLVLLSLYLVTTKGFSDITDAEAYYLITKSIVERGRVDVTNTDSLTGGAAYWRNTSKGADGRKYSQYWLGYPVFQVPWYIAGKWAGAVLKAVRPSMGAIARFLPRVFIDPARRFAGAATTFVRLNWSSAFFSSIKATSGGTAVSSESVRICFP